MLVYVPMDVVNKREYSYILVYDTEPSYFQQKIKN